MVEELTLYTLDQETTIAGQNAMIAGLVADMAGLKAQMDQMTGRD